ncbi:MAG: hypothetical protein IIC75_01670, partial [Bacteroidetes bacterium]|nr:hypothetical protein [Bacteroidota bacterium]
MKNIYKLTIFSFLVFFSSINFAQDSNYVKQYTPFGVNSFSSIDVSKKGIVLSKENNKSLLKKDYIPGILKVQNTKNDSNVTLVGRWASNTPEVVVRLDYAYVADWENGLHIIDISDPFNPTEIGFFETEANQVVAVAVGGNYAYVVGLLAHGLQIIDISDPSNPTVTGIFNTPHIAFGVAVGGNYAYVADWGDGIRIIDISDPSSPTEIGFFDTQGTAYNVTVSGDYAYIADHNYGMRIIDISNPFSPTEIGFFDTGNSTWDIAISGNYAYIADYRDGLRIIDISDPSSPTEIGFFDTGDLATGVAVSGNYAYVADGSDGLRIIDISDPYNPTETGFFDTDGFARRVVVSGNYIYVADVAGGLYIFQNNLITDINEDKSNIPTSFSLSQNYPNPFNPETVIKYQLSALSFVSLKVYDLLGREVAILVNEEKPAGTHTINFNAKGLS